jgi:hypothetical protein
MKQITIAITAIIVMLYLGFDGMQNQTSSGPFFMFLGVCTAVGFALDIINVVRTRIRKANIQGNIRKLGR